LHRTEFHKGFADGLCWPQFAFQRPLLWEIPLMARLVWFRAAVSVSFPFLAAAIAMAIGKP